MSTGYLLFVKSFFLSPNSFLLLRFYKINPPPPKKKKKTGGVGGKNIRALSEIHPKCRTGLQKKKRKRGLRAKRRRDGNAEWTKR